MDSTRNKELFVICGPTAAGKTAVSIALAQRLGTAVVSADSRQIYREIPIGTAQPQAEELASVPHHFIGTRSIHKDYNAGMYARDALAVLNDLFSEHDSVVMCGGTGLYIKAVCEGLDEVPPSDAALREKLSRQWQSEGLPALLQLLETLDPVHFARMDRQNPQRVIRALEVCLLSGKPFSSFLSQTPQQRPFSVRKIGIHVPKKELDARIAQRTLQMMAAGWLDEAKAVFPYRHLNALNTVGYKELFDHLDGNTTLEEAVQLIQLHTAQFAKRQMTWFRKDTTVEWMTAEEAIKAVL
jgi:tRNA dimethylallyltransferase